MSGKSLSLNQISLAQAATGISPADFPLGSLESRVAARALLDQAERMRPKLSDYDRDALTLYRGSYLLTSSMSPNYQDLEQTEVYRHGEEIASQTKSTRTHEKSEDILARSGLSRRDVCHWLLARYAQAWARRLPALPFPIKVEGWSVYFRHWKGGGTRKRAFTRT